jgi:hypothetical protein
VFIRYRVVPSKAMLLIKVQSLNAELPSLFTYIVPPNSAKFPVNVQSSKAT